MTQSLRSEKHVNTVAASQTYREMVRRVIEAAPTQTLDLHAIYDALCREHAQYREDAIDVDWKNSIRHCLSINDIFIRIYPEAITDISPHPTRRNPAPDKGVPRTYWTTAAVIHERHWQQYIFPSKSNVRKASKLGILADPAGNLCMQKESPFVVAGRMSGPGRFIAPKQSSVVDSKREQECADIGSHWVDPSSFLDLSRPPAAPSITDSPLALDAGKQTALFTIAVIEQNERAARSRNALQAILQDAPPELDLLKTATLFFDHEDREPAMLPSPFKEGNCGDSPLLIGLPSLFNHPI